MLRIVVFAAAVMLGGHANVHAATVTAGDAAGAPGATVVVDIIIDADDLQELSLQLALGFDADALTLSGIAAGELAGEPNQLYSIQDLPGQPHGIILDAVFDDVVSLSDRVILAVSFAIAADADETVYAVTVVNPDLTDMSTITNVPTDGIAGAVTVVPVPAPVALLAAGLAGALAVRRRSEDPARR